jgi:hypothetical protein
MPFKIITYIIEDKTLQNMSDRRRNQLFGCMHAHNELTFLNRLLSFTLNPTASGELHEHAQANQMWCVLQLLSGKLFETWQMLTKRISLRKPVDPIVANLSSEHQKNLTWLITYFGDKNWKKSPIKLVRDTTAFHYSGIDMGQALNHIADRKNIIHLAEHPANTLYYLGSAVVFRTIFAMVVDQAKSPGNLSYDELIARGSQIVMDDVNNANFHLHEVL